MPARSLVPAAFLALISAVAALADEPLAIGTIVADPEPYHLRYVTLQGTVQQVQVLEPYRQPSGTICYSTYLFTLQDDTGSLDIAVLGTCGLTVIRPPDVSDGDRIMVKAQVQAPGHLGTLYGLDQKPLHGVNLEGLHAIAKEILPLGQ
jgi:hypothetical protein